MPFAKRSIEPISVQKDVENIKLFEDDDNFKLKKKVSEIIKHSSFEKQPSQSKPQEF